MNTGLGKRMPFILTGTVLAVIFMMMLPAADNTGNFIWFVIALFATLLSMGLYRSPAVALMPDLTPNRLRSKANAVINLMGAVGGVYTLVMIKLLVGKGDTPDYMPLFVSVAALMAIAVGVLVITIRENALKKKLADELAEPVKENECAETGGNAQKTVLSKEVKRSLWFMLASIFLWFTAYNAVTTAFSRYTKVVWKLEGGGFADCLMVATIAAIVSYIPIGYIAGRFGRKKTIMGGVLLMAAQIFTPILSGALLENISYRTLFPYALVFSLLAFLTMTQVKHGDVKPVRKESLLEHFDVED